VMSEEGDLLHSLLGREEQYDIKKKKKKYY